MNNPVTVWIKPEELIETHHGAYEVFQKIPAWAWLEKEKHRFLMSHIPVEIEERDFSWEMADEQALNGFHMRLVRIEE